MQSSTARRILILAAAASTVACSVQTGGESTSSTSEDLIIPIHGARISLSPGTVVFGTVPIGTAVSRVVIVRNTGSFFFLGDIVPGAASNPDYSIVNGCAGKSLAPGATCTLTVTYKPSDALSEAATVTVTSNAVNGPATLSLSGNGSGAAWNLSSHSFDFGGVGVGSTSIARMITLTNIGSVPIDQFAGGGVAAPFGGYQDCGGKSIAPGGSCHWYYTYSPTVAGPSSGSTTIATNVGSANINLTGTGVGAQLFVSTNSIDFGNVGIGTTSPQRIVTLANTGLAPLTGFAGGGIGAPFGALQNCAGTPLAPGASCQWFYSFAPTSAGTATGSTSIWTNGGTAAISLKGTGTTGQLALSATNIDLGSVGIGHTATHSVLVTNVGTAAIMNFAGGGAGSPFGASQDCAGKPLAPGASCHWYYTFTPTSAGPQTATTSISTDGGSANITVTATGVAGGPVLTASDNVIAFGNVGIGQSPQVAVTLTNTGTAPVTGFAGGGISAPFGALQNCAGNPLQPGASCQWFYTFSPTTAGAATGTTEIVTNAGSIPITTEGTGVGGVLTVSTNEVDFGDVLLGASAPPALITLTNTGLAPITNFAGGGLGAPWTALQNCAGSPLLPGSSCTWQYGFIPTVTGYQTANTQIATDGGNANITVTGNGVGGHLSVNAQDVDFGSVEVGHQASQVVITLTNTGPGAITNFAGGGIGAPWSALQNCAGKPLLQGQSCQWFYGFAPTFEGLQIGSTEISTDGGSVAITLVGYATP